MGRAVLSQLSEKRTELVLTLLRKHAQDRALTVSADERVGEQDAARLLSLHPDSLARMRLEGRGPPAYVLGLGRARISYRLIDLASWVEGRREKFDGNPT
jgi:hypothetical protein